MGYTFTYDFFVSVGVVIVDFFSGVLDFLFKDLWTLITYDVPDWLQWFIDALDFIQLDVVLSNVSLISILFSFAILGALFLKFFK